MSQFKVLISAPYLKNDIELFRDEIKSKGIDIDVYPVRERMEEDELLTCIDQYHGVVCGDDRFTERVIDAATNLKVIVKWGTGIDSINKVYANSKGIEVCNTLDAFTEPVSESVIAAVLSFARGLHASDQLMKAGHWQKVPGKTLFECSMGIIGFGKIGQSTAKKLNAFGMRIYANDTREISSEEFNGEYVNFVSKEELLQKCDFVATCTDLNSSSAHLMSSKEFTLMKEDAIFINMARGPLVDEPTLIEAIKSGQIAGAALDVFEDEPLPVESPLRSMNNVLLSSHNVNASPYHWNRVHRNSLNMLYEVLGIQE